MIDGHKVTERTSLIHHELYATVIDKDLSQIDRASAVIAEEISANGGTIGERMWQELLQKPWRTIRRSMLADTPEGRLLRSNSPFSIIIGIHDPETRRRLWRQAKHDLLAATT